MLQIILKHETFRALSFSASIFIFLAQGYLWGQSYDCGQVDKPLQTLFCNFKILSQCPWQGRRWTIGGSGACRGESPCESLQHLSNTISSTRSSIQRSRREDQSSRWSWRRRYWMNLFLVVLDSRQSCCCLLCPAPIVAKLISVSLLNNNSKAGRQAGRQTGWLSSHKGSHISYSSSIKERAIT